jgi:hypothetical protein
MCPSLAGTVSKFTQNHRIALEVGLGRFDHSNKGKQFNRFYAASIYWKNNSGNSMKKNVDPSG